MADDKGMVNPHTFKRRLLRAAVQDNVNLMKGAWPQRHVLPFVPPLSRFSHVAVAAIALAVSSLIYVAVTTSKAPQAMERASLRAARETAVPAAPLSPTPLVATAAKTAEVSKPTTGEPLSEPTRASEDLGGGSDALSGVESIVSEQRFPDPRPLDFQTFALVVKKIVIDPGHGGEDPGAVVTHGLTEKEITLDIGVRLRALLQASSFDVRMTREKDETRSLVKRSLFANEEEGDLFVSIHVNWITPRQARVVETYYLGATEDKAALQLAGAENHQSGYSTADFRRLLDGVYSDIKRSESRRLAQAVQSELAHALHDTNPSLTPRAVKTAPFAVLVGANMPAILTEVACLSNEKEAQLLATPEYRQQIAQALYMGIRSYANALDQTQMTRKESPS